MKEWKSSKRNMNDYHEIVKYQEQMATNNLTKKTLKGLPGLGKLANWFVFRRTTVKQFLAINEISEDEKKAVSCPPILPLLAIFTRVSIMLFSGYYLMHVYYHVHHYDRILYLYCIFMILIISCFLKIPSSKGPNRTLQFEKEPLVIDV